MLNFLKRIWAKLFGGNKIDPVIAPIPIIINDPITIPIEPGIFLGTIKGATIQEISMLHDAASMVSAVIKSQEFKDAVLETHFTSPNSDTNDQILSKFVNSHIIVNIDMFLGTWYQNHISKTIGYDNNDDYVHMNRYFVTTAILAGSNMIHEIAHALGYHHMSSTEYTSVPYSMNTIFADVSRDLHLA